MVVAWSTSALTNPVALAENSEASWEPPEEGSGPVSARLVVTPSTVAWTTVARPLNVVEVASAGPAVGQLNRQATISVAARNAKRRETMPGMGNLRNTPEVG